MDTPPFPLNTTFKYNSGLLPGLLATNQADDPQRIAHQIDGTEDRTRNLRLKLDSQLANQLNVPVPVKVRFVSNVDDFDNGMPDCFFADTHSETVKPTYIVMAIKQVKAGTNNDQYLDLRSIFR